MADLSAYINFSVLLDKQSGIISINDTSAYPAGVAPSVTGVLSITQPDMVTVTGSFGAPDIRWNGSSLVTANTPLRLAVNNAFQKGAYIITYTVRAAGYLDTVLTKSFNLQYHSPSVILQPNFDVFTPNLSVQDISLYDTINGFSFIGVDRNWDAVINNVDGTVQEVSGNAQSLDLVLGGLYWDSRYDTTIASYPTYRSTDYPWLTIHDYIVSQATYYAEIPPTLIDLRNDLTTLKVSVDANICDCNLYSKLRAKYVLAQAIYQHMIDRGRANDTAGLSSYVYQLQKLFNNDVTPTYVNTNEPIPAYDWGLASGESVYWFNILDVPSTTVIEWQVGNGGPVAEGGTQLVDARFNSYNVRVFRTGIKQYSSNPGDGTSYYTKNQSDNFVTFFPALTNGELICVETIPI